ncbi:hypothetical protein MMC14_006010 [Varicellaria rhodocarpa]|nr:hypothetical protein [Varicellaria rhodocarpa]
MHAATTSNCTLWNGGDLYGTPTHNSLTLLRQYYDRYPEDADKVVLNIKGAIRPGLKPDSTPKFLRENIAQCLEMPGPKGKIDMFECARRDPNVPLADTLLTLSELVDEGKIGGVALSEVSAATIREAANMTKIVAVEVELSLFSRDPLTNGIIKACAELDIPIIAYSPLGRGILTATISSPSSIPEKDMRKLLPRYQPDAFATNILLVNALSLIAQRKQCTPAQLALGWLLTLSKREDMPTIIPIPGATQEARVRENAGAAAVELSSEEMEEIDGVLEKYEVVGERYHAFGMKLVNG